MAIDLTGLPLLRAVPAPFRLGGTVRGALGHSQQINRLGDRWTWEIETPAIEWEPDGRLWSARLTAALRAGALLAIPQPRLPIGPVGSPIVAAATVSGRTIPVAGLQPGAYVRAGQWLSIIVGGRRYSDMIEGSAMAASDGTATIIITNLLRTPLAGGETIEIAVPKVEGTIESDTFGGGIELSGFTSFAFTLIEDE